MKNQLSFWVAILGFSILVQVGGQIPNPNAATSSCGGVLELSSGILNFSPVDQNEPDVCMWVIKLPTTSQNIQFQLAKIPPSSTLNLYSQEGYARGQNSLLPLKSLTTADINLTVNTNSSTLIAIWTPSRVKQENLNEGGLLSFTWDELSAKGQNKEAGIHTRDSNVVSGVSYAESDRGEFSWAKPGKGQQTLLWVLNSKSPISLQLKIETKVENCNLADPCLCSYFGVYEVYDNFLRAVSTECGRSSNVQWSGVRPRLVALGFVNPEFRRDTNLVTLTWNGDGSEEGTTTSRTTPTTTEAPNVCKNTNNSIRIELCSSGFPKSCSEIQLNSSEVRNCLIYPNGPSGNSVEVLCDFKTDGGGWTIIQKRSSRPKQEFNRTWAEYASGFGSLEKNSWIGLETIYALTKNLDQELRIELEDHEGLKAYAKYSNFSISDASDFYRLSIRGFSGDAGNSMTNLDLGSVNHGMRFSTRDKDNDLWTTGSCSLLRGAAGWWFNYCGASGLNGLYFEKGETLEVWTGIHWNSWKPVSNSLAKTEMKIRTRK